MATQDYTQALLTQVRRILFESGGGDFETYWKLSQEVIGELPVRQFHFHRSEAGGGYVNIGILTGEWLVDIVGSTGLELESRRGVAEGRFDVLPLRSIESIQFNDGPISTLPESHSARTMLLVFSIGRRGVHAYWIAENKEEHESLVRFGRALMEETTRN